MSTSTPKNSSNSQERTKVTTRTFRQKKAKGEIITMLTAYDYPTASAMDEAGIDCILVGDTLAMVELGYETTLSVTVDDMLHHCKAVARGAKHALLIGDMPFMSYQVTPEEALRNAGRFLQEANMQAVKMEGGQERAAATRLIVQAGIPVMGHIGLTPQSINEIGGFLSQGRSAPAAKKLLEDALALEEAGAFSIVLEAVPQRLAELISQRLRIPTIGIGAGLGCDGQVLVTHDLLGQFDRFTPKFVKQYANIHGEMVRAFNEYIEDVTSKAFPTDEHSYHMKDEQWEALLADLGEAQSAKA
jgi:3-methyl-2-oxobutanoate hydroxymethyltransferase